MLRKWEAGDKEVVSLWKMMNEWVYDGFNKTYDSIGVDFDTLYYESHTYLLGKEVIKEGLEKEVFFQKKDGSIWCDLTEDGLDEKIVQRSGNPVHFRLCKSYQWYQGNLSHVE